MPEHDANVSFLEHFVIRYYTRQSAWVRGFTFLLFVLLLAYLIYHGVAGEYRASGYVYQVEGDYKTPAKHCEVRVGTDDFGTNSKGQYSIILNALDYAQLWTTGKMSLEVFCDDKLVKEELAEYQRRHRTFKSVVVKLPVPGQTSQARSHDESWASSRSLLVPQVWASIGARPRFRLFVYAVNLKPGVSEIKAGQLELHSHNSSFTLLDDRARGSAAGLLPLLSGNSILFRTDYYFSIPEGPNLPLSGTITLTARTGYFSSFEESFPLPGKQEVGRVFEVHGNQGSQIKLLVLGPYDVTLFEKTDLENIRDALKSKLMEQGFGVRISQSPQGAGAATNALFAGKAIPFQAVQTIARIAADEKIALKKIEFEYTFSSTSDPYEIQLGHSASCIDAPEIPKTILEQIASAPSELEFKRILQPNYSTCSPRAPSRSRRKLARKNS